MDGSKTLDFNEWVSARATLMRKLEAAQGAGAQPEARPEALPESAGSAEAEADRAVETGTPVGGGGCDAGGDYASPSACAESAPRLSGRASPSESPRHSDADSSRRAEVAKAEKNRKGRRNSTITTGNSVDGTPPWSEEAGRARSGSVAMAMPHAKVREARAPRPDEHASPAQVLSLLGVCEP